MEIANQIALAKAAKKHPQAAVWLASWADVVRAAAWQNIRDVRAVYRHADAIPLRYKGKVVTVVTCFNVGGNDYRLLTGIDYSAQLVVVVEVLTHAEYDKNKWKKGLT